MTQIRLNETAIVSDPCYEKGTWCQAVVKVKPGLYDCTVKTITFDPDDKRHSMLFAVHEDYESSKLEWKEYPAVIGVDSGQCGIFSEESYRNDEIVKTIGFGDGDVSIFPPKNDAGDEWYLAMCSRTLGGNTIGSYPEGIVTTSGFGDGSYRLYVAKKYNKVIALCIDYAIEEEEVVDFTIPKFI
jgi:hypothetical protein